MYIILIIYDNILFVVLMRRVQSMAMTSGFVELINSQVVFSRYHNKMRSLDDSTGEDLPHIISLAEYKITFKNDNKSEY